MYKHIPVFVVILFLFGCSSMQLYKGEKLPPEQVVKIEGTSNLDITHGGNAAKICAFDTVELDSCQPFIEFQPGEHILRIEVTWFGLAVHNKRYKLNFEAGERYRLGINNDGGGASSPALMYLGKYNKNTGEVDKDIKIIQIYKYAYR